MTGEVSGPSVQDASKVFLENNTNAVHTCIVHDPNGSPIQAAWSLDMDREEQQDEDKFTLSSNGLLEFKSSPDYESPASSNSEDGNIYVAQVIADVSYIVVRGLITVTVTDVDEEGTVTLSTTAPVVGHPLGSVLGEPDGGVTDLRWQWLRRLSGTKRWEDVSSSRARSEEFHQGQGYTPKPGDVGYELRATVGYTDVHGPGKRAQSPETAPAVDVPSAPRNLEAAAGNARVELRWDPPLTDNGSALTGYEYRQSADGGVTWAPDWGPTSSNAATATRLTVRDLTNGTEYSFEVRAVNGAGAGASARDTATPARPDTRGRVEWSTTQPRVGQELTPTLIDPDNPALAEARWRWRRLGWLRSDDGDSLSAPAPESRSGESKLVSCRIINCTNN